MKRLSPLWYVGILITTVLFFYKTFFFGLLPFPGDLFVAEYQPWKNESFLGYVSGSFPNKAQYFDALTQMIPWKIFSWDSLRSGIFPLWNPHNFSGVPYLANIQAALLYPFTYLGTVLAYPTAWSIIVIIQPLLAGLFMLLFMQSIGIISFGAFFAAIAFAFSQFMTVFLEYSTIGHVVLWLPLSLFSIERYLETKQKRFLWFLALSIVLSAFAGHLQLFASSSIFIVLYTILRSYGKTEKHINIPLIGTLVCALGISAVQLLPTLELATLAARVPHDINFFLKHLLIQPKELFLFLSPDAFGNPATRNFLLASSYPSKALSIGLVPLLFTIGAIIFVKTKDAIHKFFVVSSVILIILLTNNPISWLLYQIPLSMLTSSSPSNIQYLLSFSMAVLSGIGLQAWITNTETKKWNVIFIVTPLIIVAWVFLNKLLHIEINTNNVILTFGIALLSVVGIVVAKTKQQKVLFVCFIILITIGERFYIHSKFNPFSPKEFFYPPTALTTWLKSNAGVYRFWGYGQGTIAANVASGVGLYDMQGYDPLYPKQYGKFIGLSQDGTLEHTFTDSTRSNAQLSTENDLMVNTHRLRLLSLGGVKYILDRMENGSTEKTFPAPYFTNATSMNGWNVMENKTVTPRAFITSQYLIATSSADYESPLMNEAFSLTQTVILDRHPDFASTIPSPLMTANIKSYTPNKVIIETQTDKPSLLVVTDTYYPGWTATIDDGPTQIYRADYAYRTLAVPEGTHTVIMQFKPLSALTGLIISISSILILTVFILII